jgi:hypothetical protein
MWLNERSFSHAKLTQIVATWQQSKLRCPARTRALIPG